MMFEIPRWTIGPVFLFFIGTISAISPYLWWGINGKNDSYAFEISYQPMVLWIIGFFCYSLGALFVKLNRLRRADLEIKDNREEMRARRVTLFLLIISLVGVISIISGVYGSIPLLGYLMGSINVNEVNLSQESSVNGQLGFVLASSFALTMAFVVYLKELRVFTPRIRLFILVIVCFVLFKSTMAGKRQDMFMFLLATWCSFIALGRSPGGQIAAILGLNPKNKVLAIFLVLLGFFSAFYLFGFLASIRQGSGVFASEAVIGTASDQVISYLQLPLINFEVQTSVSSWGPAVNNIGGAFWDLVPYKLQEVLLLRESAFELPPRAEPGIGSGFFGNIHWFWGTWGIVFFSILCGAVCQWLYDRSRTCSISLAIYCHFAWTLVAAHSYNHFFLLTFGVLPVVLFIGAMLGVRGWEKSRSWIFGNQLIGEVK